MTINWILSIVCGVLAAVTIGAALDTRRVLRRIQQARADIIDARAEWGRARDYEVAQLEADFYRNPTDYPGPSYSEGGDR